MTQPTSNAPLPDPGLVATRAPGRRAARRSTSPNTRLLGLVLIGAAVSLTLGVYGKLHTPAGVAVNLAGFSGPLEVKTWLASVAAFLALVQLASALVIYGKVPAIPS